MDELSDAESIEMLERGGDMVATVLITGAAGFIGSHLAQACLERGQRVIGVDNLSPYYSQDLKRSNLAVLRSFSNFRFIEGDLLHCDLASAMAGVDTIFHLAAQPGVRASWGEHFEEYVDNNIVVTQRLLEACRQMGSQTKFVFASSSSVYGRSPQYPTPETAPLTPHSPYGVTKLAAENLVSLYAANYRLPTVSLRYFTVYGPRQRPDMAMFRLLASGLGGPSFQMFGDGSAVRDFTYVTDVVAANLKAAERPLPPGTVINVSGGDSIDMRGLVTLAASVLGTEPRITNAKPQLGDVEKTGASVDRAFALLDWSPAVTLEVGLKQQMIWLRDLLERRPDIGGLPASV